MPGIVATAPAIDLTLPDYEADETQPLPLYSSQARSTECLLQVEPQERTGCPTCEWIYTSKHLRFNLGRKLWKLSSPTYGLNGIIEGSIQLIESESMHPVESLRVTVRNLATGFIVVALMNHPTARRPSENNMPLNDRYSDRELSLIPH